MQAGYKEIIKDIARTTRTLVLVIWKDISTGQPEGDKKALTGTWEGQLRED